MPDNVAYTIQVPIRQVDAEDVKNAFAKMFSYPEKVDLGFGVLEPNPITKEVFVEKCCAQFLFNIYKNYMVQKAENDAKIAAENESNQRSQEVVSRTIGKSNLDSRYPNLFDEGRRAGCSAW